MIDPTPLNIQIEQALKEEIISGRLAPGQKIVIEELADRWKVSTTPIRDAVRSLEKTGFVKVAPRKAIHVETLDMRMFKDVFDIRIALEGLAVELALPNISSEQIQDTIEQYQKAYDSFVRTGDHAYLESVDHLVHDLVLRYCGNQKLIEIYNGLRDLINWARNLTIREPSSYEMAHPEHMEILYAMFRGNPSEAQEAMKSHLRNSFSRTCQSQSKNQ